MAACLEEFSSRADVELYTTPHVIADLEEVREHLGYERVVLWGGSGGTRTALVWMRRHPDRVATALIDGIAPTSLRAPSGMARAAHDALTHVFEDCAAQPACRDAYPSLDDDFRKVLWIFESGPVATKITHDDGSAVPVAMTRGDFAYALRGWLYRAQRLPGLPGVIHEMARTGDVSPLAQALWLRDTHLRPAVSFGVLFAVYCAEDMPFIDDRDIPRLTDGTFVGTYLIEQYGGICEIWDAGKVSRDYLLPTTADVPTLIFSGYYDPSTPPALGDEVHRHLPNSRHVVVRDQAHGAGFGCGRQASIDFLTSGSLEGLGPICEDAMPIQFTTP